MSDPARLIARLGDLLLQAADELQDDPQLRDSFAGASHSLEAATSAALDRLLLSLRAATPRPAREEPPAPPVGMPIVVRYGPPLRRPEAAVIVPLGNPAVELRRRCLESIARNFDPATTLLVLYSRDPDDASLPILAQFSAVELRSPGRFSLPTAYSHTVAFLREEFPGADLMVLVFMDDDAEIVGDQRPILRRQEDRVRSGEFVLVSGHYFDFSPAPDFFADAINCSGTPAFAARVHKPYCHGGAAMMMQSRWFPRGGLPESGLGGISLGVLTIDALDAQWRGRLARGEWYIRNEPQLVVQHPRKSDLVQWSATYLAYSRAWNAVLSRLTEASRTHWQRQLQTGRCARIEALLSAIDGERVAALGNILLTRFYKPRLAAHLHYSEFSGLSLQTHCNLLASGRSGPMRGHRP